MRTHSSRLNRHNNYGAGATGDAALIKDLEGYHTGAGRAVQFQKNGQIFYQKAGFTGDTAVLKVFGANSAQDYKNQKLTKLNQQVIQTLKKAKDERKRRLLEIQKHLKDLENAAKRNSPMPGVTQSTPNVALITVGAPVFNPGLFGGGGAAATEVGATTFISATALRFLSLIGVILSIPGDTCQSCNEWNQEQARQREEAKAKEQAQVQPIPISTPATPEPP